jgi:hypothetical protein
MSSRKINTVERITYAGGLYGLIAGSSRGKLQAKVEELNQRGYNLHLIHPDSPNLLLILIRLVILILTLGIWTFGASELLVFEKDSD